MIYLAPVLVRRALKAFCGTLHYYVWRSPDFFGGKINVEAKKNLQANILAIPHTQ